jgi:hypothetical protein
MSPRDARVAATSKQFHCGTVTTSTLDSNKKGKPMMKRLVAILSLLLLAALSAGAQTPTYQTWSLTTSAVTLPGGKQTFMGVDSGLTFTPTPNLDLLDRNLVATGAGFEYFGGGINYRIPALSNWLNNKSPNVDGLRLQIGLTVSAGVDRITSGPVTTQHYAWTGGGFANYKLTAGGAFMLGVKAEYLQAPGQASHFAISLNPSFHF